jgi:hypothetical protein
MSDTNKRAWNKRQANEFVRWMMLRVGEDGWDLCVPRIKQALVHQHALEVIRMQQSPVSPEAIELLVDDMEKAAGL